MTSYTARRLNSAPFLELYKREEDGIPVRMPFNPKLLAKPTEVKFSRDGNRLAIVNGLKSVDMPIDDMYLMTTTGERVWSPREDFLLLTGSATNTPRLYVRFGTALRKDVTDAVVQVPAGVYIQKAAFSADSRWLAVVYSNAPTVLKIFKYGYLGFALYEEKTVTYPIVTLFIGRMDLGGGYGHTLIAIGGASQNQYMFYANSYDASGDYDPLIWRDIGLGTGAGRLLGLEPNGELIFFDKQVNATIGGTAFAGRGIGCWRFNGVGLMTAANGTNLGLPGGWETPGFVYLKGALKFYMSSDGRTVVITADGIKSPTSGFQYSSCAIATFNVYRDPNPGATFNEMVAKHVPGASFISAHGESSLGGTSLAKFEKVSDVRFAPDSQSFIVAMAYFNRYTSGSTQISGQTWMRRFQKFSPINADPAWQATDLYVNVSSSTTGDPHKGIELFNYHPNFDNNAQGPVFEGRNLESNSNPVVRQRILATTGSLPAIPTNRNWLGSSPPGTGYWPFAVDHTLDNLTEISYSPTGRYVIFKRSLAQAGYHMWRKDATWTDATKVAGTFTTVLEAFEERFQEIGYHLLPENTDIADLVFSVEGTALAFHATNADTPEAVNGRYILDTSTTVVERGREIDAEMLRSRFAFSPTNPLAYFAAAYDNGAVPSELELYKFAPGQASYAKTDTDPTLYGPVSFSNCDDVLVAHGLEEAPFSFFKREGDLLVEQPSPPMDWSEFGEVIDIEFLPDCSGFVVVTPDKIVVVELEEGLVPDPENPGQEVPGVIPEVKAELPIDSSKNDGSGGDGKSQPGDPSGVEVVTVVDPSTGQEVISVIVERLEQDVDSPNTRPDTAGYPPLPTEVPEGQEPPPEAQKGNDYFDLTPDKELIDRNNPFYVSVNVGFEG